MKKILAAALAALICTATSALATTANTTANTPAPTNAPAAAATNANPEAALAAMFGDPVIVRSKSFEIKRSELDQELTRAKTSAAATGQNLPPEFAVTILNRLIAIQLLLQKATDADRATGKQEAELQLTNIMKRFASPEAFERQLKVVGMTMDELLNKATQEAVFNTALRRELNVAVTDAAAKDYYDAHSADFEEPEKVHLRDILLLTIDPTSSTRQPLTTDQQEAKRKQINDILKRLRAGEEFTNLTHYSEDPNSKDKGGELPPVSREQMGPELSAAAFSLTNGQTSDVIETAYGYYLLKLLEKLPAKKYGFNETLPQVMKTPAELCKSQLEDEKTKALAPGYMDKLKAEDHVEILDPTLKSLADAMQAAATNAPPTVPGK